MDTTAHEAVRQKLIAGILEFLAGQDLLTLGEVRSALEREIEAAGPDALISLNERLATDAGWNYYDRDRLARRIHHVLADRFLDPDSGIDGIDCVATVIDAPVAIFSNHLSYADANAIEVLLYRSGAAPLADRLTAIAGPKVFLNQQRRFSSLCFGTIKVPQSAGVSSEEAVLNARDVARAARHAIGVARTRLIAGDALLLFGEGTRSRTGAMQRMLPGVARYLAAPDMWIVPAGLTGSEALFPVGDTTIRPARIAIRFGPPIRADVLLARADSDRRVVMDAIGLAIGELVPAAYRGVYDGGTELAEARATLDDARR